jgi:hypothetical protein
MLKQILDIFTYTSIIIISLFIIGYISTPPILFLKFTFIIKVLLALLLLYKYGYKKEKINTELDRRIIVMISIFILLSSFTDIMNSVVNDVKKIINPNSKDTVWFKS